MNLDELAQRIISSSLFLKLKNVIENNPYHNQEDSYSNSLSIFKLAKEKINGDFITNQDAKSLYLEYVNQTIENIKRKDIMLLVALIHDIGKILHYEDNGKEFEIRRANKNGVTRLPAHEYWGSTIVKILLKDENISEDLLIYISNIVRLHDTYSVGYFSGVSDWSDNNIEIIIDDIKARAENYHVEALFNIYCDNYTSEIAKDQISKITDVFNNAFLYASRKYFIK